MLKLLTYSSWFFAKLISCGCMFALQVRKPICGFEGCVIKLWVTRVWMFIRSSIHLKQSTGFPVTLWAAYSINQGSQHQPNSGPCLSQAMWPAICPSQKETSSLPEGCEPGVPKWENTLHLVSDLMTNSYSTALYISYYFFFTLAPSILIILTFLCCICFEIKCHHLLYSVCLLSTWLLLNLEICLLLFDLFIYWIFFISMKLVLASFAVIHLQGTNCHCYFCEWMRKFTDILILSRSRKTASSWYFFKILLQFLIPGQYVFQMIVLLQNACSFFCCLQWVQF